MFPRFIDDLLRLYAARGDAPLWLDGERLSAPGRAALDTRTPVLLQALRYMDFRPCWNVPRSILVKEVLPALRRRPNYLRDNDMEVVGARDAALRAGLAVP